MGLEEKFPKFPHGNTQILHEMKQAAKFGAEGGSLGRKCSANSTLSEGSPSS